MMIFWAKAVISFLINRSVVDEYQRASHD